MRPLFTIKTCSPMAAGASAMIDALDRYQGALYPAESNHLDSRVALASDNCKFLGAYRDGTLVGIGAAKKFSDYGELKRFYVPESERGQGIAELLIATLEFWLARSGIFSCHLETGIHQAAALGFYAKLGYKEIDPFGEYKADPLSVFMAKDLPQAQNAIRITDPFYLVTFTSKLVGDNESYSALGDEMIDLARHQKGFIGMSSVRNADGAGFTASYWESLNSIANWRRHPQHLEAQRRGKVEFYESFRTSVASVTEFSL